MRRDIARRIDRLEARAGISADPPPKVFVLFPTTDAGVASQPNHRYGQTWQQQPDEEPEIYHDRIAAQLMAEGESLPFLALVFADPPRALST